MLRLVSGMLSQSVTQSCCRTVAKVTSGVSLRHFSNGDESLQTSGERKIINLLKSSLNVSNIEVHDISGGCGSMYEIFVEAENFRGMRTLEQHRLVNKILKEEVKEMHGLRIHTDVP